MLRIFRLLPVPVRYEFDSASKVAKISSPFFLFYSKDDTITPSFMPEILLAKNGNIISFAFPHGYHRAVYWFTPDLADLIKKINKGGSV